MSNNNNELPVADVAAIEETSGGHPILVVAGAVAGVTAWVSNGGYQDAVDFTSGLIEGFANAVD